MSVSNQMKELREMLGVENNTDALSAVRELQRPSRPVVVAVSWTPDTPDLKATISVLSGQPVHFPVLSATLRAGLAVIDFNMAGQAAELQALLQQEKARNESKE